MSRFWIILLIFALAAGCANNRCLVKDKPAKTYTVMGKTYQPMKNVKPGYVQKGTASWYGPGFHGKKTANGEVYDMNELTAAHNVLPLNSVVRVKNLDNNKEITVRINDRGPFVGDRVLDLSLASAKELGMTTAGTAPVRITVIKDGATGETLRNPLLLASGPNPYYSERSAGLLGLTRRQ
jgi:rare lipoprotein A